jgi:hypothetical protein
MPDIASALIKVEFTHRKSGFRQTINLTVRNYGEALGGNENARKPIVRSLCGVLKGHHSRFQGTWMDWDHFTSKPLNGSPQEVAALEEIQNEMSVLVQRAEAFISSERRANVTTL